MSKTERAGSSVLEAAGKYPQPYDTCSAQYGSSVLRVSSARSTMAAAGRARPGFGWEPGRRPALVTSFPSLDQGVLWAPRTARKERVASEAE